MENTNASLPTWAIVLGALAVLWNAFGVFQFIHSVVATKESLISMGMTEAQANVMASYPTWMTIAFGVGTLGGLLGSMLFLWRKPAQLTFLASLVGYLVLYVGDITEGVFEALGMSQVIILSTVVIIAAGLLWLSNKFRPVQN